MAALVGVTDKEADDAQPLDPRAKVGAEVETKEVNYFRDQFRSRISA
jgi:hypothetical protein